MILNTKVNETIVSGTINTSAMTIDSADQRILMKILSEGLYKDAIGSTIREWTSNALDSHTEAGVDDPVLVKIEQDPTTYSWWLRVQDFGVGISPDRQENVVRKYAASTKRHDNTMLGAFGLGLKAGLAYADSFTYITRYEGKEYLYIMYKGEEETNIDLLSVTDTTERNGTTFQLQIKNSDVHIFRSKARQQLCYFEKVYFVGKEMINDFKIYKHEDWKYSQLVQDKNMHLCLDNVYYPLDFDKLNIDPIRVPIGLNFKLGEGLTPVPSREDISYTPEVIKLISERIVKISTAFVETVNSKHLDAESVFDLLGAWGEKFYEIPEMQITVPISSVSRFSAVELKDPSLKGVNLPNLRQIYTRIWNIFGNYEVRGEIERGIFYGAKCSIDGRRILENLQTKKFILTKEKPKGVQLDFIKDTVGNCRFIYQTCKRNLGSNRKWMNNSWSYVELLNLSNFPKNLWRTYIIEFQKIEKQIEDQLLLIEDLVPTPEWLAIRKANRAIGSKTQVNKEQVNPKWPIATHRINSVCSFSSTSPVEVYKLRSYKSLYVYDLLERKKELENVHIMGYENARCIPVVVNQRDFDKLERANLHNWINLDKFMEGKNKPFQVFCTALLIEELASNYNKVFKVSNFLGKLNKDFKIQLEELENYVDSNSRKYYTDNSLKVMLLSYAKENNLFDSSIMGIYNSIVKLLPNLEFIGLLKNTSMGDHDEKVTLKMAADLLKYRKIKLNLEWYQEAPKEVVVVGETIIEATDVLEEDEYALMEQDNDLLETI